MGGGWPRREVRSTVVVDTVRRGWRRRSLTEARRMRGPLAAPRGGRQGEGRGATRGLQRRRGGGLGGGGRGQRGHTPRGRCGRRTPRTAAPGGRRYHTRPPRRSGAMSGTDAAVCVPPTPEPQWGGRGGREMSSAALPPLPPAHLPTWGAVACKSHESQTRGGCPSQIRFSGPQRRAL